MTIPRDPNPNFQQNHRIAHDHGGDSLVAAVAATFTLTADTNANMADADIVTLNDGERSVTYEYDKSANGVVAGRIAVTAGTTAASVATNFATAIAANQPRFSIVDNLAGVLTITNKIPGADGNQTNSKTSASALAVTNGTGGADATIGIAGNLTMPIETVGPAVRFAKVEILNPTGFVADASNYWTIALKKGSTVMASWSTQTGAQGTITGGTAAVMLNSATDANLVAPAAQLLTLTFTKTGTPSAFPAGRVVAHGYSVA